MRLPRITLSLSPFPPSLWDRSLCSRTVSILLIQFGIIFRDSLTLALVSTFRWQIAGSRSSVRAALYAGSLGVSQRWDTRLDVGKCLWISQDSCIGGTRATGILGIRGLGPGDRGLDGTETRNNEGFDELVSECMLSQNIVISQDLTG